MEQDESHTFQHIFNHYSSKGKMMLKVNYLTSDEQLTTVEVPFEIICNDVPLELARFIKENVIDKKRGGFYTTWAMKKIKGHTRRFRKLYRSYNVTMATKTKRAPNNRKRRPSRNQRNTNNRRKEKF